MSSLINEISGRLSIKIKANFWINEGLYKFTTFGLWPANIYFINYPFFLYKSYRMNYTLIYTWFSPFQGFIFIISDIFAKTIVVPNEILWFLNLICFCEYDLKHYLYIKERKIVDEKRYSSKLNKPKLKLVSIIYFEPFHLFILESD